MRRCRRDAGLAARLRELEVECRELNLALVDAIERNADLRAELEAVHGR